MNAFVVITSKRGAPIPRALLRSLAKPDLPDVPFRPDAHLLWTNDPGTVAYVGWQAATWRAGIGSHWHVGEDALTAWSGLVLPRGSAWPRSGSWAAGLADLYRRRGPLECLEDLVGIHTTCRLACDGEGTIVSDPWGIGTLFWAEDGDVVAVSNRTTLAARAVSARPERDPLGMGWLPFVGYIIGSSTGLRGVSVVPHGAYVRINRSGRAEVAHWNRAVWMGEEGVPREELLRRVRDDLLGNVASLVGIPAAERKAGLTGGKDTRLILALLFEAGALGSMSWVTTGLPHHPDVIVARELAARLRLDHEVEEPRPLGLGTEELLDAVRADAYMFTGMLGSWNLKRRGSRQPADAVVFSGVFGETLRAFYTKNRTLGSWEEVERYFRPARLDFAKIVLPEACEQYAGVIRDSFAELRERGVRSEDAPDAFYLRHRMRRWFGTDQQLTPWLPAFPLQSLEALRAGFRLGLHARQIDGLHFELVRGLAPELSKLPFALDRWHEDNWRGLPDAEEYLRVEPCMAAAGAETPLWQRIAWPRSRTLLQEYLLADPSNPLFGVINRRALERALLPEDPPPSSVVEALYATLTAAVWLASDELVQRCGEEAVAPEARALGDVLPVRIRTRIDRARREEARAEARKARAARPPMRRALRVRLRRVPVLIEAVRRLRGLRGIARRSTRRRAE
ncbi:MAG: hypothetical protein HY775_05395 [Acidobacteria bacterium]|nr:hypothetical protein [Acidobacteriota bacterium]